MNYSGKIQGNNLGYELRTSISKARQQGKMDRLLRWRIILSGSLKIKKGERKDPELRNICYGQMI